MKTFNIDVKNLDQVRTKKITFKGQTSDLPVYRIPINQLFYNDLNGRISTYISEYKAKGKVLRDLEIDDYNNTIADYIKLSSKQRHKITKEDIRINTQKEVGVVLSDGRIIDGNRRFTCLRELFAETGDNRYAYFEAVVLPTPSDDDHDGWKQINSLELELQIGTDEKVDYNPIDWLVKIYLDIVKDKSYTEKEYARLTKKKDADIKKLVIKAEIMEDFLEFFDKPEQFYFAKTLELDGPLTELASLKKKLSDKEWNLNKSAFYVYLYTTTSGDRTREIRNLIKNVYSDEFRLLVNKSKEIAEEILDGNKRGGNEPTITDKESVDKPNIGSDIAKFGIDVKNIVKKGNGAEALNKPISCCESALKYLNEIDNDIVNKRNDESKKEKYNNLLNDLEKIIGELKKHVS